MKILAQSIGRVAGWLALSRTHPHPFTVALQYNSPTSYRSKQRAGAARASLSVRLSVCLQCTALDALVSSPLLLREVRQLSVSERALAGLSLDRVMIDGGAAAPRRISAAPSWA